MANVYLKNKTSFLFAKKSRYIAIGILLGLSLLYLVRSCVLNKFSEINYQIGQDTRWQGLYLMGKERNLSAFNQELLTAIAKQANFHFYLTTSSHPIEELWEEKLQGILTTVKSSYLYENRWLFSDPYFLTGPVLIVSSTNREDGWNENRKKIIGIQKSSPFISSLEQDPSIQMKFYDDILPALSDLTKGSIDGAIFPIIPASIYIQTFYKHELNIATSPLTDEGIRLMAPKNQEGEFLIQKFNEGLKTLKENGNYQVMLERWGLINTEQINP